MKKRLLLIITLFVSTLFLMFVLTACDSTGTQSNSSQNETANQETKGCTHTWKSATCTAPKTCSNCQETSGTALGHSWKEATCTTPKTCSVCAATSGSASGHTWINATCTTPKTCSVCTATSGSASGHTWINATCTTPKTCRICQETSGTALGHSYDAGACSVCGGKDPNYYSFGSSFDFLSTGSLSTGSSNLRITIGNSFTLTTVTKTTSSHYGKTVVRIPVTVKNIGSSTGNLNSFDIYLYNSNGNKVDSVMYSFADGSDIHQKLRPSASISGAIYILYSGKGTYYITFDNIKAQIDITLPITK